MAQRNEPTGYGRAVVLGLCSLGFALLAIPRFQRDGTVAGWFTVALAIAMAASGLYHASQVRRSRRERARELLARMDAGR